MKTRAPVAFLAFALAATALTPQPAAFAAEGAPSATAAPRIPSVTVVEAAPRTVVDTVIVTGTLVPFEEVQVPADVEGWRITEILVEAGDHVEEGQVLARLDTDMLDIQLAQSDSQLARATSAVAQAEGSIAEATASKVQADAALERTRALIERGVVAQDVLDQRVQAADAAAARLSVATSALAAARADRALVEAQRRELDLRRAKTEIRAPKGGLVLERNARVGAIASAAAGALFRIAEGGRIELEAEASEVVLAKVRTGQKVSVLPAGFDAPLAGTVRLVSPEVSATTRLGTLRVALPETAEVRVGAFARGTVEVGSADGVAVPVTAVQTGLDGDASVQVVSGGVVERRPVVTGLSADGYVEIREGLTGGEVVVARAGTFLRAGDKVAPVEVASEETN